MKKKSRILSLMMAGITGFSLTGPVVSAENADTINMVSNSHLDTVWSWDFEQTIEEYLPATFADNFALIENYPDYQFNFEGAYRYQLLEEYYPELFEKLQGYIDSGNWNVIGSALENGDVNVPSPEALFRNILYGNNYFDDNFGVRSKDIFLPDCFGFGYALPSIIAHSNLLGFSTQKLSWGNTFPNEKLPFDIGLWEGPDSNSIIANINYNAYTSTFNDGIRNNSEIINRLKRSPIGYTSALYGTGGDRGGGVPEGTVKAIANDMASNESNTTKVVYASTDDIFKNMTEEERSLLDTYVGEFLLKAHGSGGYTSRAISKRWNRRGELLGDAAERALVVADWLGSTDYPIDRMEEIWTRLIAHQFHDDIPGTSNSTTYKRSWNDYMIAIKQFAAEYESGVAGVVQLMDTTVSEGVPIVVNNPVAVDRLDVVEADVILNSTKPFVRVYDDKGNEVPSQVLSHVGDIYKVAFQANVKSLGYRTFKVVPSDSACKIKTGMSVDSNQLSNKRYKVTINQDGDISSIYDKQVKKELLSAPVRLALFDNTDVYWSSWEINIKDYALQDGDKYVSGAPVITVLENGSARVALKIERTYGDSTYSQIVSLGSESQVVKVDNVVNWNEKAKLLKAEFNLASTNPKATYDLGLGVIERGNNTVNQSEAPVQKWADLTDTDGSFGVSILNDCKYGMDKRDDDTLRLTLIHTPYNDFTHSTGFNAAGQAVQEVGENRFAYGIYGHKGTFADSDVQIEAESFNQPMNAFQTVSHTGNLGTEYSFGSVDNDKIIVRAIKKAEKTDEIIVRVNEGSGKELSGVSLSLGNGIVSAREVYASEEEIGPATVENDKLKFDIGAYGVKTFAITLKDSTVIGVPNKSTSVALPFNIDVYSGNSNKADGGINLIGDSYPSELLSDKVKASGVEYTLGSRNDGEMNAVTASGQTINLPDGYSTLKFLAASTNKDKDATFLVDDKEVTLNIGDYSENIAAWDLKDLGISGYVKDQTPAVIATHRHTNGKDNIGAITYMFSYSLDIKGATTVTLPSDSNIILFAATALDDTNTKLTTISTLYDKRERTADVKPESIEIGFESGDKLVTTNYTTNKNNTSNLVCDYSDEQAKDGSYSLKISGTDDNAGGSFVYFTLSTDPITVLPGTTLTYDFYAGNELGRYTAIDMEFNSGVPLRDRGGAVDQNGVGMHPAKGHGEVGKWVTITCDLYKHAAGSTISKLMFAYDHPGDTGEFTAYVDNVTISTKSNYIDELMEKANNLGDRSLYTDKSLMRFDNALSMVNKVLESASPSDNEKNFVMGELEAALNSLAKKRSPYENIFARDFNEKIRGSVVVDTVNGSPANIGGILNGNWTIYQGLQFGDTGSDKISIYYSGQGTGTAPFVEVHLGSATGELIGTIPIPETHPNNWSNYQLATATLTKTITGEQDICLVFKNSSGGHVCNVDYFVFTSATEVEATEEAVITEDESLQTDSEEVPAEEAFSNDDTKDAKDSNKPKSNNKGVLIGVFVGVFALIIAAGVFITLKVKKGQTKK